jgi:hypothetical protein
MTASGAEQKSGEIAANFCLSPETRHSRCCDPTAMRTVAWPATSPPTPIQANMRNGPIGCDLGLDLDARDSASLQIVVNDHGLRQTAALRWRTV